tara:strand:+ start:1016 stop:1219 length:204 start_codon:yes stop_codon:yes gene_type:complete
MTAPREELNQVKRAVSINYTSTGKVGFWVTVEAHLPEEEILAHSDSLISQLLKRYSESEQGSAEENK